MEVGEFPEAKKIILKEIKLESFNEEKQLNLYIVKSDDRLLLIKT